MRGKFPHVRVGDGPLVYVAEFSNGVIKVGFTANARTRLSSLATQARGIFGALDVEQMHVTEKFSNSAAARSAEFTSLQRIEQVATRVEGRGEYFTGISFDEAVRLVAVSSAA
jgi:predicted GIY-YIG superfamily endonuclease